MLWISKIYSNNLKIGFLTNPLLEMDNLQRRRFHKKNPVSTRPLSDCIHKERYGTVPVFWELIQKIDIYSFYSMRRNYDSFKG